MAFSGFFDCIIDLHEIHQIESRLKKLGPTLGRIAITQAVNDIAEDVIGEAKLLVPVRRKAPGGVLRRSAFTQLATPSAHPEAKVGFGVRYAWPVHENPRAGKTHGVSPKGRPYKNWADVGQWHYLEIPFAKAAKTFRRDIALKIETHWGAFLR